jgi:hypothetical protein
LSAAIFRWQEPEQDGYFAGFVRLDAIKREFFVNVLRFIFCYLSADMDIKAGAQASA